MDFADQIRQLAAQFQKVQANLKTEEATKQALIMPLLQALGFNVFDPTEVVPEFTADIGTKKGEKVDYALMVGGKPMILIEAKGVDALLDPHTSQLLRYFGVTEARFGILTNGLQYQFFSDLENKNKMDTKPFLTLEVTPAIRDGEIAELKKFHKSYFNTEDILSNALTLKYIGELKKYLRQQITEPEEEFSKFLLRKVYAGSITTKALERLTPVVKQAFAQLINEIVSDKLTSALEQSKQAEAKAGEQQPLEVKTEPETTQEELEAFYIIKAILRPAATNPDDIQYKDTKSYFVVCWQGRTWKWVCRLKFQVTQKTVVFPLPDGRMEGVAIESIDKLYDLADRLRATWEMVTKPKEG